MTERLIYLSEACFHAARCLPDAPAGHPERRLHGHSFAVRAAVSWPTGSKLAADPVTTVATALRAAVAVWDYRDLNAYSPSPSDEWLARVLRARLMAAVTPDGQKNVMLAVGVRSTADRGVTVDLSGAVQAWQRFRFEAAHFLPRVTPGHPCGRMHGHSFEFILFVHPADAVALAQHGSTLRDELDRSCLNELPGLENPTSEWLCHWLWQRLIPHVKTLTQVTVRETATAGCRYDGSQWRIWKEQRFESAVYAGVAGDPAQRRCGHSYRVRLHLHAPFDECQGWTVDYGVVRALFRSVYEQLDHHDLSAVSEMDSSELGALARWIGAQSHPHLPWLESVELYATPEQGVVLHWGATPAPVFTTGVYEL